ncbi:hypothetical protein KC343_g8958 [Hortaea werneckii]|nr:hypothetical protein KC323_g3749 [Hortaea werneckii]KAI6869434.1 hypothetical protein KC338_g3465 [Hortaea werneckii]KAI7207453.1 hypothetical protein KC352_g17774 [Hortaea werneckii]KAI7351722.1 hypothetical protein KC320_g4786 [Hortaea werneckii]KAI7567901.1 hypothetical protein KC317_g4663 [Hortaea werneckii]
MILSLVSPTKKMATNNTLDVHALTYALMEHVISRVNAAANKYVAFIIKKGGSVFPPGFGGGGGGGGSHYKDKKGVKCNRCKRRGHYVRDCPALDPRRKAA